MATSQVPFSQPQEQQQQQMDEFATSLAALQQFNLLPLPQSWMPSQQVPQQMLQQQQQQQQQSATAMGDSSSWAFDPNQFMTFGGEAGEGVVGMFSKEPQLSLSDNTVEGQTTSSFEKETFFLDLLAPQSSMQQLQQQQQRYPQQQVSTTLQQLMTPQQQSAQPQVANQEWKLVSAQQQQPVNSFNSSVSFNGSHPIDVATKIQKFDVNSNQSSSSHRTTPSPKQTLTIPPNQSYAGDLNPFCKS